MKKSEIQRFLERTAVGAGQILIKYFQRVKHIQEKHGAGIVTEADQAAESYIVRNISRKFSKSTIITEETGEYPGDDALCWFVDPLDGTVNYAHGFPWFCVSIGVYEQGRPRTGVIFHPLYQDLYFAEAGKGAWHNGKRMTVSRARLLKNSLLGTGFSYFQGSKLKEQMRYFLKAQQVARGVRRPGAAALDLAYVASGRFDGFWEAGLQSWDVAAGILLVQEAGGRITDFEGEPVDNLFGGRLVASNGKIHNALLKTVGYRRRKRG